MDLVNVSKKVANCIKYIVALCSRGRYKRVPTGNEAGIDKEYKTISEEWRSQILVGHHNDKLKRL